MRDTRVAKLFAVALLMIIAAVAVGLQAADAFPRVILVFYAVTLLGDVACFILVSPNELSGEPQTA